MGFSTVDELPCIDELPCELATDCRAVADDPWPSMAGWSVYFRLAAFKWSSSLPAHVARRADVLLLDMRARLEPVARHQFARWERQRRAQRDGSRHSSPRKISSASVAVHRGAALYQGTVRGLLPQTLSPRLSSLRRHDPQPSSKRPSCGEMTFSWREAEVRAVIAHLQGPQDRISPIWQPVVLRIPVGPSGLRSCLFGEPALSEAVRGAFDNSGVEAWRLGDGARPHWRSLHECLQLALPGHQSLMRSAREVRRPCRG